MPAPSWPPLFLPSLFLSHNIQKGPLPTGYAASVHFHTVGCRCILLKLQQYLLLWFVFGLQLTKVGFPLSDWVHVQNPPFLRVQPQWQLHPPQGKVINYGWMFDWQRLNDRSSVLTQLPHIENLVPIVLFKTCQMITVRPLFTQQAGLALNSPSGCFRHQ